MPWEDLDPTQKNGRKKDKEERCEKMKDGKKDFGKDTNSKKKEKDGAERIREKGEE